jgi:DNA-binding CsgD family transcriptional regulator
MELDKDHITLTSTQALKDLCNPLTMLQIDFFAYLRYYQDGTCLALLTDTKWFNSFLSQEQAKSVNVFNLKSGYCFWKEIHLQSIVAEAENYFGIYNPFNMNYQKENYLEVYTFASQCKDYKGTQTILTNLDLLEKFNIYFKSTAVDLIEKLLKNRITIPEVMRDYAGHNAGAALSLTKRKKFLQSLGYQNQISNLTVREYQCLRQLSHGMAAKYIANKLNISVRTVETHIENLKDKLNCQNKSQLAELYWQRLLDE